MTSLSSRLRTTGCLLAAAIGDALGAGVEFLSLDQIRHRWGQHGVSGYIPCYDLHGGAITDDTQMTLLTVEAIRRSGGDLEALPSYLYRLYSDWAQGQVAGRWPADTDPWLIGHPVLLAERAPGHACLSGLTTGSTANLDQRVNPASKGCGTTMRSAAFGLVPNWSPEEAFAAAVTGAVMSHGHDTGLVAAGALAMIVRHLLEGVVLVDAVETAVDYLDTYESLDTFETVEALQQARDAAVLMHPGPETVESLGGGWTAEEALAIAVYCALVLETEPTQALLLAVNHGGDSDSTGSICGNLLGAALGTAWLPTEWVQQLEPEASLLITQVVDGLATT